MTQQPIIKSNPQKSDLQIAVELSKTSDKLFFVDTFRKLLNQYDKEEISLSKVVEELNIIAYKYAASKQVGDGNVWQLCPKCQGQGNVEKPPGMPVEVQQWSSNQTSFVCDVCGGAKIIAQSSQQVGEENRRLREALVYIEKLCLNCTVSIDDMHEDFQKIYKAATYAIESVSDAGNKEE